MSRINRRAARPIRVKPREPYKLAPRSGNAGPVSRDAYPVRVKSHDGYIECPPSLLAEISAEALQKPPSSLHLKLEIGGGLLGKNVALNCGLPTGSEAADVTGVLIGKKEESRTLVTAYRRIGPRSFSPDAWERAFGGLMARVRWDPKLAGLQLVGWFRANPQAMLAPSRRDLEIFHRFFPEFWQFGLVLKPEPGKTSARFFLRQRDRSIDPQNGFQDALVRWDPQALRPLAALPPASSGPSQAAFRPAPKPVSAWPVAALLAAGMGVAWFLWHQPPAPTAGRQDPASVTNLSQQASQQAEAVWKQWEADARRQADNLQTPPAKPVEETEALKPEGIKPESTKLESVKPETAEPRQPSHSARAVPPERRQWPENVEKRLASIREQVRSAATESRSAPPAQRRGVTPPPPQRSLGPSASALAPAPPPASTSRSVPEFATLRTTPVQIDPFPQPPVLPSGPDREAKPLPEAALPPVRAVPPRPTPAASSTPAATPAVPRSGRLIWTGHLGKNEYLVFDGGKPSTGSATGALPGKPVDLAVSPGDLTRNGLVVYTARLPKPGGAHESPGPQNGWNNTLYEWDPARTTDFEVVEAPNANNGWKRLVLRARNPKHSIVMVEWSARP